MPPLGFRLWAMPVLALLVVLTPAGRAEQGPPQLEQVRVGLPAGSGDKESGRVRSGCWTPVYLKVKAGKDGVNPPGAYKVLLQANDAEDVPYTYVVALPALAANQDFLAIGYLRPGSNTSEVQVFLETNDNKIVQTFPRAVRDSGRETVAPSALLVLSVGSRLTRLKNALDAPKKPVQQPGNAPPGGPQPAVQDPQQPPAVPNAAPGADEPPDDESRRFAFIESVEQMPDQWFGYESADVVVLTTGKQAFVTALLEDKTHRCDALLEWVRRGGRVVLSVGSNQQTVARLLKEKLPLLNCSLTGRETATPENLGRWLQDEEEEKPLELASLKPGPGTSILLHGKAGASDRPLLVQGSCGLGRVVLVAFDLDTGSFTKWSEARRRTFWDKLLTEVLQRSPREFQVQDQGRGANPQLSAELQGVTETFADLPVIHFGWVTLFILVYILIVGPLDYFVLKKLFKRLELTWITFPSLVLLLSVLAYAIAYRSKGSDVRINQIDLVEYDLHDNQVYGNSWCTLFSPRVARYTLGLEPAAPQWAGKWVEPPSFPETLLATINTIDRFQRFGPRGCFRIPTPTLPTPWALMGCRSPSGRPGRSGAPGTLPSRREHPRIQADIKRSRQDKQLPTGTIANNLPVELRDITLFYQNRWYNLGELGPGVEKRIDEVFEENREGHDLLNWLDPNNKELQPGLVFPGGKKRGQPEAPLVSSPQLMKALMFHAGSRQRERGNSGLRSLDQSWRIRPLTEYPAPGQPRYRSEIVLVARVNPLGGSAEKLTADNSTPTRLWLGELPGEKAKRPALPGQLWQETYVRVYIPVK